MPIWNTLSPDARGLAITNLVLAVVALAGIGASLYISRRQQEHDKQERRDEREYQSLRVASQQLRLSLVMASKLDYQKSNKALLDITSWGIDWQPVFTTLAQTGSALAIVADEIPKADYDRYRKAAMALLTLRRSDEATVAEYVASVNVMVRHVDSRLRLIAGKQGHDDET